MNYKADDILASWSLHHLLANLWPRFMHGVSSNWLSNQYYHAVLDMQENWYINWPLSPMIRDFFGLCLTKEGFALMRHDFIQRAHITELLLPQYILKAFYLSYLKYIFYQGEVIAGRANRLCWVPAKWLGKKPWIVIFLGKHSAILPCPPKRLYNFY